MTPDPSPEERAVEVPPSVIEAHARTLAACASRAHFNSMEKPIPEGTDLERSWRVFTLAAESDLRRILQALSAAGLHITDLTGEEIELLLAGLGEIEAGWINAPDTSALTLKLRRLAALHPDEKGS